MKKTIILTIIIVLLSTGAGICGMFDHQGVELSIGGLNESTPWSDGDEYDFQWARVSLFNRHDIDDNWNIVTAGNLGYLWWISNDNGSDRDTFSLGAELVLYRRVYKKLSAGLGAGLATLLQPSNKPNLGNSGLYGTFTGRLKLEMFKDRGVEFAIDHISGAIDDDPGENVIALKLYYMFN